jgi:hypothetical protein
MNVLSFRDGFAPCGVEPQRAPLAKAEAPESRQFVQEAIRSRGTAFEERR